MPEKKRLDLKLVELGLAQSRTSAQALILAQDVLINGQTAQKTSQLVEDTDAVAIREKLKYVSRGGLKLEKAFEVFALDVRDKICLDIGASTGGFTDCLLQNGAKRVYALDVGHGQLDYSLRQNEAVISKERYNARNLDINDIEPVSFACADVSFISLKLILLPLRRCLEPNAEAVVLIKPQFEAGREKVQKGGVIRDPSVRMQVCHDILQFAQNSGYIVKGLQTSPIKGPKGNEEYLLWLGVEGQKQDDETLESWIKRAVDGAQA